MDVAGTTTRCRHILLRTSCRSLACTLLGVHLSGKLAQRVVQANLISHDQSHKVKAAIQQARFALTRQPGTGRDGPVDVMDVVCSSGQLPHLVQAGTALEPRPSCTGIGW